MKLVCSVLHKSSWKRLFTSILVFLFFCDGQLDALLPVVHGRDVFVRMATGAGKSLCMFLAPLAISESAVGVVISPLNGLMEQQVRNLLYCVSQLLAMTKT